MTRKYFAFCAKSYNDNTITYDENLKNQKYPYKIWTKKPDNQTEPYRGDWLN